MVATMVIHRRDSRGTLWSLQNAWRGACLCGFEQVWKFLPHLMKDPGHLLPAEECTARRCMYLGSDPPSRHAICDCDTFP